MSITLPWMLSESCLWRRLSAGCSRPITSRRSLSGVLTYVSISSAALCNAVRVGVEGFSNISTAGRNCSSRPGQVPVFRTEAESVSVEWRRRSLLPASAYQYSCLISSHWKSSIHCWLPYRSCFVPGSFRSEVGQHWRASLAVPVSSPALVRAAWPVLGFKILVIAEVRQITSCEHTSCWALRNVHIVHPWLSVDRLASHRLIGYHIGIGAVDRSVTAPVTSIVAASQLCNSNHNLYTALGYGTWVIPAWSRGNSPQTTDQPVAELYCAVKGGR